MRIYRIIKLVALLAFICSLVGCGQDTSSNGTLTLSAAVAVSGVGTADLTAGATVSPARAGTDVTLTATQFGWNKTTGVFETVEVYTNRKSTNSAGSVSFDGHSFAQSQVMATSLQVTVTCQGLSQTSNLAIPMFVP